MKYRACLSAGSPHPLDSAATVHRLCNSTPAPRSAGEMSLKYYRSSEMSSAPKDNLTALPFFFNFLLSLDLGTSAEASSSSAPTIFATFLFFCPTPTSVTSCLLRPALGAASSSSEELVSASAGRSSGAGFGSTGGACSATMASYSSLDNVLSSSSTYVGASSSSVALACRGLAISRSCLSLSRPLC